VICLVAARLAASGNVARRRTRQLRVMNARSSVRMNGPEVIEQETGLKNSTRVSRTHFGPIHGGEQRYAWPGRCICGRRYAPGCRRYPAISLRRGSGVHRSAQVELYRGRSRDADTSQQWIPRSSAHSGVRMALGRKTMSDIPAFRGAVWFRSLTGRRHPCQDLNPY